MEDKKQFPPPSPFSTQAPIKEEDLGEAPLEEADIDVVGAEQVKIDSNSFKIFFSFTNRKNTSINPLK